MRELPPCYNKALDLLSRRSHFRRELGQKLLKRGYEDHEIESVLDRLEEKRFLDDRETAFQFARAKTSKEPIGRARLISELGKRGVDADLAREVAAEFCPEDDRAEALAAAERWRRRRPRGNAAALARYLSSRGFSGSAVHGALESMSSAETDPEYP